MEKQLWIFILLIQSYTQQIQIEEKCSCSQLTLQNECNLNLLCMWIDEIQICKEKIENQDHQSLVKSEIQQNCQEINSQEQCKSQNNCAWFNKKCQNFQSCEIFYNITTFEECQSISNICVSDGMKCININTCTSYLSQKSCQISNNRYCYWDEISNLCQDVIECSQLPNNIKTEEDCRKQLKGQCSLKVGGGCEQKQIHCTVLISEEQCNSNKNIILNCIWLDQMCQEKSCENAPKQYINYQQCNLYLSECTLQKDGGCIKKGLCSDIKFKEGCYKDIQDRDCYWTEDNYCVEKKCNIAPTSFQTNYDCQQFFIGCITNGQGCIDDITCSSATIEQACIGNRYFNRQCVWIDEQCKIKNCENAGIMYKNHEQCQNFMFGCTYNGENCVSQQNCSYYTENACQNVISLEGPCIWIQANESQNAQCRKKKCHDIINDRITCLQLDGCVIDGQRCQIKTPCQMYETKQACNNLGLDGICVWSNKNYGQCEKMENCQDAHKNQYACVQAKDRCYWKDAISYHQSQCLPHTCETYQMQTRQCQSFFDFSFKKLNICKLVEGQCRPIDVTLLNKDECHLSTEQQYCWNPKLNSCVSCSNLDINGKSPLLVDGESVNQGLIQMMFGIILQIIF